MAKHRTTRPTRRTHSKPTILDGAVVKQLRQAAGLSQEALGRLLKCSQVNVSHMELTGIREKAIAVRVLNVLLPDH